MDQSNDSENERLTNTDINDPENLDYEDIDEQNPVKKSSDEDLTTTGAAAATKTASDEGELVCFRAKKKDKKLISNHFRMKLI